MTNRSDELPQIAASACGRFISMQPEILSYLKDVFRQVELSHEVLLIGHTGLWRYAEKVVSAACWKVRFQLFRTVTFDTLQSFNFLQSSQSTSDITGAARLHRAASV